eukprot:6872242-Pyramimonas_sp.AAC.1
MQQAGRYNAADCNEQGERRNNGPLWPRIFMALVAHFLETMASAPDRVGQQAVAVLGRNWGRAIKEGAPETLRALAEHARYCRIRACWFDRKFGERRRTTLSSCL